MSWLPCQSLLTPWSGKQDATESLERSGAGPNADRDGDECKPHQRWRRDGSTDPGWRLGK